MSEVKEKISLEEIYKSVIITTNHGYFNTISKDVIFEFAKEACRQALELAAENATTITDVFSQTYEVDKDTIIDTINQIE